MRTREMLTGTAAALLLATAFAPAAFKGAAIAPAAAQTPPISGPPPANAAARKALADAANALGMLRGVERALDIVNTFEYTATGTLADPSGGAPTKVNRITAGYDYVIPAARVDVEIANPDDTTKRSIEVASGTLAWDEATPGVFAHPAATAAAQRLRQIWLLPHGVILAGAKALDRVQVGTAGGMQQLTVTLPDGTEAKGTMDGKGFITHVEFKAGAQTLSADYADFKDYQGYGVMFPARIVTKVDGRTVADLTVSEALANPYLVFPPPKEIVQR